MLVNIVHTVNHAHDLFGRLDDHAMQLIGTLLVHTVVDYVEEDRPLPVQSLVADLIATDIATTWSVFLWNISVTSSVFCLHPSELKYHPLPTRYTDQSSCSVPSLSGSQTATSGTVIILLVLWNWELKYVVLIVAIVVRDRKRVNATKGVQDVEGAARQKKKHAKKKKLWCDNAESEKEEQLDENSEDLMAVDSAALEETVETMQTSSERCQDISYYQSSLKKKLKKASFFSTSWKDCFHRTWPTRFHWYEHDSELVSHKQ